MLNALKFCLLFDVDTVTLAGVERKDVRVPVYMFYFIKTVILYSNYYIITATHYYAI